MERNTEEWVKFVEAQKQVIIGRLNRYNDAPTIKTQLAEIGDLTGYQRYKTSVVSPFLREALEIIKAGKYGICKGCKNEIPLERLKAVPGAIYCVSCDSSKEKKDC
jgi:hypothetical protein